ncbi:uncharacterized protein OCT59_026089 [Rhizophagus irregularis]|uniref:Uncharacterized protein n=1 Tax=Rhizophagus irregularis TaxID=588596 RepID=A0A915YWA3_9GLOM|nr:hypothetical protein OCT59_026089 [Rhizophagus irregularis]CAB5349714.1 unnamed protein product [Rhizophagus irregularis]
MYLELHWLGSSRTFGYSSNILLYCYFFIFTGIVRGHRGVARSVCLGEALQGLLVDWTFFSKTIFASKQILLFMNLKRHELIFLCTSQLLLVESLDVRTEACRDVINLKAYSKLFKNLR